MILAVSCKDDEDDPIASPQITSVSPNEGLPGTQVTITGTNLANATSVTFGNDAVTPSANTATSITVTVPTTASPGPTQIRVTTVGGSDSADFTVLEDDPGGGNEATITAIDPTTGGPGTEVTITGTNFTGATGLTVGETEVAAEDFEVDEAGENITFTIPEDAAEGDFTGQITVTTPAGTVTSAEDMTFTFTPDQPTGTAITSVSPTTGGPGSRVTVTGTNLTGITTLNIGETQLTAENNDFEVDEAGENITFTIPEDATEGFTGPFTVTTAEGEEVAGPEDVTFTFGATAPGVTSIDPEDMTGAVGDVITITGRNLEGAEVFFTGADDTEVQAEVDPTSTTETLVFTVPEGAETGIIRIVTPEGETQTATFTVGDSGAGQAINANGGFEDAEVGAVTEGSVPGWVFGGNDGELATFEIVDDQNLVQEGERALAVNILQIGANPWSIEARQEGLEVEPNTTYSYSIWTMGEAGATANFTVGLPEEGNFAELGRQEVTMTGEWQEVTMEFTTGDDGLPIRTPVHFSLEGNAGQTIYIDNLQIMPAQQ